MSAFKRPEYDQACAVFSRPVRFVEWRTLQVDDSVAPSKRGKDKAQLDWIPFGNKKPDKADAWKWIEGERWIYVFRRSATGTQRATWVDELHVVSDVKYDAHGKVEQKGYKVSAVAMSPVRPKGDKGGPSHPILERDARGKAVELSQHPRFARRVNGQPQQHFFFATRIRLHKKSIEELQESVADWAPPVLFEDHDPNIVDPMADEYVRVPVLDPLTIAMHLHDYFMTAAREYLDYVTPHEGLSKDERQRVAKRLMKATFTRFFDDVLTSTRDDRLYSDVVGSLKGKSVDPLQKFVKDFTAQVAFRLKARDQWGKYLANWLRAAPLRFLGHAHTITPLADADAFLVPWLYCFPGGVLTPALKAFFTEVVEDESAHPWFHEYVLPKKELSSDVVQATRKTALAATEGIKAVLPIYLAQPEILHALEHTKADAKLLGLMKRIENRFPGIKLQVMNIKAPPFYKGLDKEAWVVRGVGPGKYKGTVEVLSVAIEEGDRPDVGKVTKHAVHEAKEGYGVALFQSVGVLIEFVNLGLALGTFWQELGEAGDIRHKAMVVLETGGAFVAAAIPVTEIAAEAWHSPFLTAWVARLTFVHVFVEGLVAANRAYDDYKDGNYGAMAGDTIVVGGTTVTMVGFWLARRAAAEATAAAVAAAVGDEVVASVAAVVAPEFLVVGFLLVSIGYALKHAFTKTDMQKFAEHCCWGERYEPMEDSDTHPSFSRTPYSGWTERYDLQLEALINVVADLTIESGEGTREAKVTLAWWPPAASLEVEYLEKTPGGRSVKLADEAEVDFEKSPGKGKYGMLEIEGTRGSHTIRPAPSAITAPPKLPDRYKDPMHAMQSDASIEFGVRWTFQIGSAEIRVPAKVEEGETGMTKRTYPFG